MSKKIGSINESQFDPDVADIFVHVSRGGVELTSKPRLTINPANAKKLAGLLIKAAEEAAAMQARPSEAEHWGITVDSEVPVTGVVNSNAVEFIDDDINDGIDLSWEEHMLECEGRCIYCRCEHTKEDLEAGEDMGGQTKQVCTCESYGLRPNVLPDHAYDPNGEHDMCGPQERGDVLFGDWKRGAKDDPEAVFAVGEVGFLIDKEGKQGYAAIAREIYTQVVWSKTTQRVKLCSPCYPGQGDLGNPGEYLAFDLPADMYGDKDKV